MATKIEVDLQKSPGFRKLLIDFCNAKQVVYNYSKEEFEQKTQKFFTNIEKITFKVPEIEETKIRLGTYSHRRKEIVLRFNPYKEISSDNMQTIIHELNHAWNFEKGKGFLKRTSDNIQQLKHPLDFKIFSEVINEAQAQILCSTELKAKSEGSLHKENQFSGYKADETIFEILCIICNQNGKEFLIDIEGKNIYDIISHISKRMNIPESEVNSKIQKVARLIAKLKGSVAKYELKCLRNAIKNKFEGEIFSDLDGTIKEGQEIYEILRDAIQQSGYNEEEKKKILLKFEAAQDRIGERLIGDKEIRKTINKSFAI